MVPRRPGRERERVPPNIVCLAAACGGRREGGRE